MKNLLRYVSLRQIRTKPMRFFLTALGVAGGVALYVAIAIINRATLASFKESVESLTGRATHTVFGDEAGFPEEVRDRVAAVPGVKAAVPMLETRAYFADREGQKQSLILLGIDLLNEATVRTYRTSDQKVVDDPLVFLNQPDSLIVTTTFAAEHKLALDDKLTLATAFGAKSFTVRGLLSPEGPAKAYGGTLAIMDIDGARATFGREGKTDRIDLVPADGVDPAVMARRVETMLGPGFRVERPETQAESLGHMVESYQALLSLLSFLALYVGLFIIANAVGIAVAERRREIGTLRALGATRAHMAEMFLAEAVVTGAVGSAVGLAAGRALAATLVKSVSSSMSAQFVTPIQITNLRLTLTEALLAVGVGTAVATIAALLPSVRAASVSPLTALKPAEEGAAKSSTRRADLYRLVGVAMLGLLFVSSRLGVARPAAFQAIDPVLAVVGAVLASPAFVVVGIRALRGVLSRLLPPSVATVLRLACDNLMRTPKRTGSNVMSLVIGLMLVVVITTINASFRESISEWFGRTLRWDLMVSGSGNLASIQVQPLDESVARELDQLEGVEVRNGKAAQALRFVRVSYEGRKLGLKAFDRPFAELFDSVFDVTDRSPAEAGRELFESPTPVVMVSKNFVMNFHKKTGDTLALETPTGQVSFGIVGVVNDFASPDGVLYMDREVYKRFWHDTLITGFGLQVRHGFTVEQVKAEFDRRFGASRGLITASNAELRKQAEAIIDEAFGFTRAVELVALLVGLLGLLNTLLVSVMERTRELGMLRAVGMSRAQLRSMVLAEAIVQGTLGAIAAGALGGFISWAWLVGSLSQMIGWVIDFVFPWSSVAWVMFFGVAVGMLAGLLPAERAAHLEIREALDYE